MEETWQEDAKLIVSCVMKMNILQKNVDKVQFVFCRHTHGHLAHEAEVQPQPPLGLLALASYIKEKLPHITVEVFDGKLLSRNQLMALLDAPIIGFSAWFSNYEESCLMAEALKARNPNVHILIGGPHPTWMAHRILRNRPSIDCVIRGEGEIALERLLRGDPLIEIPGVVYRDKDLILEGGTAGSWGELPDMDHLPFIDLSLLLPAYRWRAKPGDPAMAAFPFSGIRGCQHSNKRCEYCSIPTVGYRTMSANRYWMHIDHLQSQAGIDYFFETGDTFAPGLVRKMAKMRGKRSARFRIYSYPSTNPDDLPADLQNMGVDVIFMGIESMLHWSGRLTRHYRSSYTIESLIDEIHRYSNAGIRVWPGFLVGLPGESHSSLMANISLIKRISSLKSVDELTVSIVMPLPGSALFEQCISCPQILNQYREFTGITLNESDLLNYKYLMSLYISVYTKTNYIELTKVLHSLQDSFGSRVATWGDTKQECMLLKEKELRTQNIQQRNLSYA